MKKKLGERWVWQRKLRERRGKRRRRAVEEGGRGCVEEGGERKRRKKIETKIVKKKINLLERLLINLYRLCKYP